MTHVFVYGSLMNGFGNNRLLANSIFLGPAHTASHEFTMVNLGYFPAIVFQSSGLPIIGELYDVDHVTLRRLDQLEGHPSFYKRIVTSIVDDSGKYHDAWVYMIDSQSPVTEREVVTNNDWRQYDVSTA